MGIELRVKNRLFNIPIHSLLLAKIGVIELAKHQHYNLGYKQSFDHQGSWNNQDGHYIITKFGLLQPLKIGKQYNGHFTPQCPDDQD